MPVSSLKAKPFPASLNFYAFSDKQNRMPDRFRWPLTTSLCLKVKVCYITQNGHKPSYSLAQPCITIDNILIETRMSKCLQDYSLNYLIFMPVIIYLLYIIDYKKIIYKAWFHLYSFCPFPHLFSQAELIIFLCLTRQLRQVLQP